MNSPILTNDLFGMKKLLLPLFFLFISAQAFAVVAKIDAAPRQGSALETQIDASFIPAGLENLSAEEFLAITPKSYKKRTGKRLGLKNRIQLKIAQRALKKEAGAGDITKGVYVLLAIIGFGWLAMGILDDWEGDKWIICLVLTLLGWLPGLIYALVMMDDYF